MRGYRVWRFRVQGLGLRIEGLGFIGFGGLGFIGCTGFESFGLGAEGSGLRVEAVEAVVSFF